MWWVACQSWGRILSNGEDGTYYWRIAKMLSQELCVWIRRRHLHRSVGRGGPSKKEQTGKRVSSRLWSTRVGRCLESSQAAARVAGVSRLGSGVRYSRRLLRHAPKKLAHRSRL